MTVSTMCLTRQRWKFSFGLAVVLLLVWVQLIPTRQHVSLVPRSEGFETVGDVFSFLYANQIWGKGSATTPFFSGRGSHDAEIVNPYVEAMRSFISNTFPLPPNAVDLGCGDFNVGKQIRNVTKRYTACDVVPAVINYNQQAYSSEEVDFRVLDIISDELPPGDIVIVRQVLQHLKNEQIMRLLPKLRRYKWAIITEHLPFSQDFVPNLDIRTGAIRLLVNSGVELTKPPFNIVYRNASVLCESSARDGRVRTTAYQLGDFEL